MTPRTTKASANIQTNSIRCPISQEITAPAGSAELTISSRDKPAATTAGTIATMIAAMTRPTRTRLSAMRSAITGQFAMVESSPRRSTSVMLRFKGCCGSVCSRGGDRNAFHRDQLRHLMEPAAQAVAHAVLQALSVDAGIVVIVGRENRGALGVVAAVDDVVENVLHELCRLLRPELVEDEEVGFEQRPQDLRLADRGVGIEAGLDLLDEILKIGEEHAARLAAVDDLDQRGDGEMRFPRAAATHEQQAAAVDRHRPGVDELAHAVARR